jgi:hypothetical protein
MTDSHSHKPELIPEDFWVQHTASPLQVLADSHHLLLMHMQFVSFFCREFLKPNLPPEQILEDAKILGDYVESVNSVINAVEHYMNVIVRPSLHDS